MKTEPTIYKWRVGRVEPTGEHIELRYGNAATIPYESWRPVALISKPSNRTFFVTWLAAGEDAEAKSALKAAREELDFYLLSNTGPDPWSYAIYHCETASNIYSSIHWAYFPEGVKVNATHPRS